MEFKRLWGRTSADRKLRLGEMPACLIYHVAVFLTNLRNYLSPNIILQYFACALPTMEEYVRVRRSEEHWCKRTSRGVQKEASPPPLVGSGRICTQRGLGTQKNEQVLLAHFFSKEMKPQAVNGSFNSCSRF